MPLTSNHLTLPMHHPLALLRHHLLGWGHTSSLSLIERPGEDSLTSTLALNHLAGGGGHGLGLMLEAHHLGLEARLRLAHTGPSSRSRGLTYHATLDTHNVLLGMGRSLQCTGSRD